MRILIRLSLGALIVSMFLSCNLFFSAPHGRENIYDDAAQITGFQAVPSSDNSIVTMWSWVDSPNLNDDRITEIQIQHSIFGYPENYVFFAGENFTDKNVWQHEWKNLTPNITHYFSLFAKSTDYDGNDVWYAPLKAKIALPGKVKSSIMSLTYSWTVDNTTSIVSGGLSNGTLDANNIMVLELGISDNTKIKSAVINPSPSFGIETNSNDSFKIYPIMKSFNEGDGYTAWNQVAYNSDSNISYLVKDSAGVTALGTNGTLNNFPIDITTPVRMAMASGSKQLVLRMDTIGITVNNIVWNDFLVIEYYE